MLNSSKIFSRKLINLGRKGNFKQCGKHSQQIKHMLLNGNKILLNICKRKYFTNLTLLCYVCLKQIVFCTSTSGEFPRSMKRKIKTLKLDS